MPIEPKNQNKGVVKEPRKDSVLDLIRNGEKKYREENSNNLLVRGRRSAAHHWN